MSNYDYDIIIIGAGPAGSFAARLLNNAKYKILLLDGSYGKEKVCGGLLSPDAQDVLARYDICLPKDILSSPQLFSVRTVDLSDGLTRYYRRNYLNVNRLKFDIFIKSLISEAEISQERCRKIERTENGFLLTLNDTGTKLSCRYIIGADGASSIVRKTFFKDKKIERYTAIQQWFEAKEENSNYSCIFDNKTSPACSWIFFKDGQMVFGGAFLQKNCRAMFEEQKRKLTELGIVSENAFNNALRTEACAVLRPHIASGICFGSNGAFLIGEAAGLISPSSFEGISYALLSAEALAEAMNKHDTEKKILHSYKKAAAKLSLKIKIRSVKRPFMYNPILRRLVMTSGITSIKIKKIMNIKKKKLTSN